MVQPGALRSGMSDEAVGWRFTVLWASYHEGLRIRIICQDCGVELNNGFMTAHRRIMHRTDPEIDWHRLLVSHMEHPPLVYDIRFPKGMTQ